MPATELESHTEPPMLVEFPVLMRLPDLRSVPTVASSAAPEEISNESAQTLPAAPTANVEQQTANVSAESTVAEKSEINNQVEQASTATHVSQPPQSSVLEAQNLRRQRALDRQRRYRENEVPAKSWWTSHVPVILIGFLCALAFTIFMARKNRSVVKPDAEWAQEPLPELNIENGTPQMIPPSITTESSPVESLSAVTKDPETNAKPLVMDAPSGLKTPALLTAQKIETPPEFKPESKVVNDTKAVIAAEDSQDNYPTTGLPSLQPANKIAQAPDESGATGPQYPTTNYPASWR